MMRRQFEPPGLRTVVVYLFLHHHRRAVHMQVPSFLPYYHCRRVRICQWLLSKASSCIVTHPALINRITNYPGNGAEFHPKQKYLSAFFRKRAINMQTAVMLLAPVCLDSPHQVNVMCSVDLDCRPQRIVDVLIVDPMPLCCPNGGHSDVIYSLRPHYIYVCGRIGVEPCSSYCLSITSRAGQKRTHWKANDRFKPLSDMDSQPDFLIQQGYDV